MITVLLDDPIICDLPIKVIKIDEFLSNMAACVAEFLHLCCEEGRLVCLDNASVRKTVGEHGSKESLTKVAACGRTGSLCCITGILDDDTSAAVCSCLGS